MSLPQPAVRESSVALWCGILAGPLAFAIDLEARYALVKWACRGGTRWLLTAMSIPLFLVALIGALLGWRGSRVSTYERPSRVHFMAVGGMALSAFFALAILASIIPDFFFTPCD